MQGTYFQISSTGDFIRRVGKSIHGHPYRLSPSIHSSKQNLWIYHLFASVLIALIVIFIVRFSAINRKKKFIDNLVRKQGPLGPREYSVLPYRYSLPDFIYIKDLESRFVIANRKAAGTVGKNCGEELTGLTDHDFYPKKLADEFRKNEIDVMATGNPLLTSWKKGSMSRKEQIWVSTTKIPLKDENGNIIGIVGIGRNITIWKESQEELEKKTSALHEANSLLEERQEEILQQQEELRTQAELVMEEKKHLRTLIDNMPDRIYIKDRKSRFIIGNIHVAKVMGAKNPEELIGKTDFDFYEKSLAEEYYRDEQKIMSERKPIVNKEERGLYPDGKSVVVSTTKVPVYDDKKNVIGIVGIGRDITLQKTAEKKLI